jgi:hypothetical protein
MNMKLTTSILLLLTIFAFSLDVSAQNLYTQSNAAHPTNEANSTTGWTGAATITSSTITTQLGTYSIRVVSTSNGGRDARYTFTATSGTVYNITIWARRGATFNNPAFANWTGVLGFTTTTINTQTWTQYNFTVTATATNPTIVAYAAPIGAAAGNEIYIDNITITAQGGGGGGGGDTQPPSAPSNLAASNIASTSLTLNWTASTDNVGVTNYRIFRNNTFFGQTGNANTTFNVTGLTASTAYSFYVMAQDAAGNNSNQSNTINATTTSGGGGGGGDAYTTQNANLPTVNWQSNNYYAAGVVGIGTQPNSNFQLSVNGDIRAKEVVVESGWSDFVFEDDYELPALSEVEAYILKHGHLKGIPSAAEVKENGVGLAEINTLLLQKIEELTLYMIDLNKTVEKLELELGEPQMK